MPRKEPRISWQVAEYSHHAKSTDWYWALGVISILGAGIAIVTHNPLFAILIVLGAVMFGFYANREPEVIDVFISEEGVSVRGFLYLFENIKAFGIDEHEQGQYLLLETNRMFIPILSVPIPLSIDLDALRALLLTKLPEKKIKEPVAHRLMEYLGL